MQRLSAGELSIAAGATREAIERLVELGVLEPVADGSFRPSDVRRVRLLRALETSGVRFESVGEAIRQGRLSLDFVDELSPDPIPLLPETQTELVERVGFSPELARRLATMLGTSALPAAEPVRADHAELFELLASGLEEGASEERVVRALRAIADGMRRVVDAQREFVDDVVIAPLLEAGASSSEILAAATGPRRRYRDLGRRLVILLLDRFVDEAIFQHVVVHLEAALADEQLPAGVAAGAIAFMDVSGYTRLAEEAGDEVAATQAARFIETVEDVAADFSGRLVKVLGDGVMVHFVRPDAAVCAAVAVLDRLNGGDLPPARVGINAGAMVRRDGDYFGSVVNVAARAADYARPHEVLVTEEVVDAWTGGTEVRFEEIGAVSLKNVRRPVSLYLALPRG